MHKFQDILYILFYSFYVLQFFVELLQLGSLFALQNQSQCLYGIRDNFEAQLIARF